MKEKQFLVLIFTLIYTTALTQEKVELAQLFL